jgi:hypothetical protein
VAGATRYLPAAQFKAPFTLGAINATPRIDAIRSFTIGNTTTATSVDVYMGNQMSGTPIFTVSANSNVTMPVEETQWLTFAFRTSLIFDGFAYLHVDSNPLAASGFQTPINLGPSLLQPNGYAPLFGGGLMQWGSQSNLRADGFALQNVLFPIAFPNAVYSVVFTLDSGPGGPDGWSLNSEEYNIQLTGFSTYIAGGPPGSTIGVRWIAIGS